MQGCRKVCVSKRGFAVLHSPFLSGSMLRQLMASFSCVGCKPLPQPGITSPARILRETNWSVGSCGLRNVDAVSRKRKSAHVCEMYEALCCTSPPSDEIPAPSLLHGNGIVRGGKKLCGVKFSERNLELNTVACNSFYRQNTQFTD